MSGIRADGEIVSQILKEEAGDLFDHIRSLDSHVDIVASVATNWLLVIFNDPAVDINVTLRIWDEFLIEGNYVLGRGFQISSNTTLQKSHPYTDSS